MKIDPLPPRLAVGLKMLRLALMIAVFYAALAPAVEVVNLREQVRILESIDVVERLIMSDGKLLPYKHRRYGLKRK